MARTHHDEQQDHGDLNHHHNAVDAGRLAYAQREHGREHQHNQQGRQVHDGIDTRHRARRGRERGRQLHPEAADERLEVAGPAHRHCRGGQTVLEQQVPANHPGNQLAHGGIAISVDRASHWHGGGKLGVAQRGQAAGKRGDDEGQRQRGAGGDCTGAGEHEDAGADDGADPHQDQVGRT